MIVERLRHWWAGRRSRAGRESDAAPTVAPAGEAGPLDPRLEVYLDQIADLPAADRAIIVGVLQQILDAETAYERHLVRDEAHERR